jgi:SP family general alpha glucoside:H+ symporter-like MFS transporter
MGGMACMCVVLFIIGALGFHVNQSVNFAMGGLLIGLNFIYNCSLGQKSIVLSRIAYQIMNIICGIIVPRMLSPLAWNWGPKSGLFWGASAGLSTLYCFLRMPEAK